MASASLVAAVLPLWARHPALIGAWRIIGIAPACASAQIARVLFFVDKEAGCHTSI